MELKPEEMDLNPAHVGRLGPGLLRLPVTQSRELNDAVDSRRGTLM